MIQIPNQQFVFYDGFQPIILHIQLFQMQPGTIFGEKEYLFQFNYVKDSGVTKS